MRAPQLEKARPDQQTGPGGRRRQRATRGGTKAVGGFPLVGLRELAPPAPEPPRVEPAEWRLLAGAGIALAIGIALFARFLHTGPAATQASSSAGNSVKPPPVARPATPTQVPVVAAAREALAAWGRFAISGDLDEVNPYFAHGGPQYLRLESEAPRLAANPLGPPAYSFEFPSPTVLTVSADRTIVRGVITFARAGEAARTFRWDLKMEWSEAKQRWLLWTVTPTRS
jgi:hypothetical protein